MSQQNNNKAVAGSKTGIIRRTYMQLDGPDREANKTGVFKREDEPFLRDKDADLRREPPAPRTLPEVNEDKGGTTGLVDFNSEGQDRARREDHPNH
jgi:hypothetical protein